MYSLSMLGTCTSIKGGGCKLVLWTETTILLYFQNSLWDKIFVKFQSPRAITRPRNLGPERIVNMICNSSLYIHIPKIKSISPKIAKTKFLV
jgi:hypothetical protein